MNLPEAQAYAIPEIARKYIDYDMIVNHTELPEFPDVRTRLLFSFLNEGSELTPSDNELYSLAASLAQVGLDTHDLVEAEAKGHGPGEERTRQLRVLAGDYFSSWFYQLLSQAGRIDVVKSLSNAICEVNRLKMMFYGRVKQLAVSAEEYIEHQVLVRTQLFLSFSNWLDEAHRKQWPAILSAVTECEILAQEYKLLLSGKSGEYGWPYWYEMETGTGEQAEQKLTDMLQRKWGQAMAAVRLLPSATLARELERIGEQLFRELKLSPTPTNP